MSMGLVETEVVITGLILGRHTFLRTETGRGAPMNGPQIVQLEPVDTSCIV
jgi:hypothetical protein